MNLEQVLSAIAPYLRYDLHGYPNSFCLNEQKSEVGKLTQEHRGLITDPLRDIVRHRSALPLVRDPGRQLAASSGRRQHTFTSQSIADSTTVAVVIDAHRVVTEAAEGNNARQAKLVCPD